MRERGPQENEAKGIIPCTVTFSSLADEYIKAWAGKDNDRVKGVLWWNARLSETPLSDIMMCQHFSGHKITQLVAVFHSLPATNSYWQNELVQLFPKARIYTRCTSHNVALRSWCQDNDIEVSG